MTKVLVIAAHPDDEVLGCGGSIAKHTRDGDTVHILFMADGVGARGDQGGKNARDKAANAAALILGAEAPQFLDLPDNRMDSLDFLDVVQPLERVVYDIEPEIVYTHHRGDLNIDHELTHRATMTACRGLPDHPVKQILSYEVASSTEWQSPSAGTVFIPNWFVDISETERLFLSANIRA